MALSKNGKPNKFLINNNNGYITPKTIDSNFYFDL